jgi:hypothetical protein
MTATTYESSSPLRLRYDLADLRGNWRWFVVRGFTVFGAEASELMATAQTSMLGRLPFTMLRDAVFTPPYDGRRA